MGRRRPAVAESGPSHPRFPIATRRAEPPRGASARHHLYHDRLHTRDRRHDDEKDDEARSYSRHPEKNDDKNGAPLHESHFPASFARARLITRVSLIRSLSRTQSTRVRVASRTKRARPDVSIVPHQPRDLRAPSGVSTFGSRGVTFSFGSTIERRARSRRSVRILRPTEWVARVGEHPHAVLRSVRHHPGPHLSPRRVSGFRLVSTRGSLMFQFPPPLVSGPSRTAPRRRHDSARFESTRCAHRVTSCRFVSSSRPSVVSLSAALTRIRT